MSTHRTPACLIALTMSSAARAASSAGAAARRRPPRRAAAAASNSHRVLSCTRLSQVCVLRARHCSLATRPASFSGSRAGPDRTPAPAFLPAVRAALTANRFAKRHITRVPPLDVSARESPQPAAAKSFRWWIRPRPAPPRALTPARRSSPPFDPPPAKEETNRRRSHPRLREGRWASETRRDGLVLTRAPRFEKATPKKIPARCHQRKRTKGSQLVHVCSHANSHEICQKTRDNGPRPT